MTLNIFSRQFDRRYGNGSVEKFKKMAKNPDITLTEIGKHFGFSRQYVSDVYKKIYGSTYTEAVKQKWQIKKNKRVSVSTNRSKQYGNLRIMTTKDVAKYLKLHEVTIISHAAKGSIPAIKIGSRWRFDKQAIDKWIRGRQKTTQK